MLNHAGCQLVTLIGMGGIGKTRLAVEVARDLHQSFADGIHFVPLQGVVSSSFLSAAISEALHVPLLSQEDEDERLLTYLSNKNLLIVLDGFERLLDGTALLTQLVGRHPQVKLLVTSREVLNLRQEWVYPVGPLQVPPREDAGDLLQYSSIMHFVECARRLRPELDFDQEIDDIKHICQLVEGIPLAIELAASWVNVLPCVAIAAEIRHSLDVLRTTRRDVPDTHRSMQVVFDQSWELLTEPERRICSRLAVFRGGFSREAAESIADTSLDILSSLVGKSIIFRGTSGRYHIHALMRQYAELQLEQDASGAAQVRARHCVYYTDYLHGFGSLIEQHQAEILHRIVDELDNIRAAWSYAVDQADAVQLWKAGYVIWDFYDFRGYYQEGLSVLEAGIERLLERPVSTEREQALGLLLVATGWLNIRLGRYARSEADFRQSESHYSAQRLVPPPGLGTDPGTGLAMVALLQGDFQPALDYAEEARLRNETRFDQRNLQLAHYVLSETYLALDRYDSARQHAQEAYALSQATNNQWMMGYILISLGNAAREMGLFEEAQRYFQQSHTVKRRFEDPEGEAVALNHLAGIARLQHDYDQAVELYHQTEAIYRTINDRGGLATSLSGLGEMALLMGDFRSASGYLHQAIEEVSAIKWLPLLLTTLTEAGRLLIRTGKNDVAGRTLQAVVGHPAASSPVRKEAARLLSALDLADANAGLLSDLDSVVRPVQSALLALKNAADDDLLSRTNRTLTSQPLVDPLSERELEILRLLAAGLSNQEIADRLSLALGTVKTHNHNIYSKLDVNDRMRAVARARELKVI